MPEWIGFCQQIRLVARKMHRSIVRKHQTRGKDAHLVWVPFLWLFFESESLIDVFDSLKIKCEHRSIDAVFIGKIRDESALRSSSYPFFACFFSLFLPIMYSYLIHIPDYLWFFSYICSVAFPKRSVLFFSSLFSFL